MCEVDIEEIFSKLRSKNDTINFFSENSNNICFI